MRHCGYQLSSPPPEQTRHESFKGIDSGNDASCTDSGIDSGNDASCTDSGSGKCLKNGVDPKYSYHGAVTSCQELCDASGACGGYSVSDHNNCLLWLETGLTGGGQDWAGARCMVKKVSDAQSPVEIQHSDPGSAKDLDWANDWDGELRHECAANQALVSMFSIHDNSKEDRRWKIKCSAVPEFASLTACRWDSETTFDAEWTSPPVRPNEVVTGVLSQHSNGAEDRWFAFKVCTLSGDGDFVETDLGVTDWMNNWDGDLEVTLTPQEFMGSITSKHDNGAEDRVWKFQRKTFKYVAATPKPTAADELPEAPTLRPTPEPTTPGADCANSCRWATAAWENKCKWQVCKRCSTCQDGPITKKDLCLSRVEGSSEQ